MKVRYIGKCGNDLTTGNHYEAETGLSPANINILADDAGDEHCVAKHDCVIVLDDRPLTAKPVFGAQKDPVPAPDYPVFDVDADWEEDEANDTFSHGLDPADYLAPGVQVIARDVEPVPDGPKSTDELRKYRYTPDTF